MLNRRNFIGAGAALGIAGTISTQIGSTQTPQTETTAGGGAGAKIGDPADVFVGEFGEGV